MFVMGILFLPKFGTDSFSTFFVVFSFSELVFDSKLVATHCYDLAVLKLVRINIPIDKVGFNRFLVPQASKKLGRIPGFFAALAQAVQLLHRHA